MASNPTVVRTCTIATKMELHSLVMPGWARGVKAHGKGGWADKLGISTVALDKQLTGSMPGLECIDKALDVEPTVLDDWLDRKGKRLVDKEHDEGVRDLTLLLAQVNLKIAEAQHPTSPGRRADHPFRISRCGVLDARASCRDRPLDRALQRHS
jgi:hypothetical protein